MPSLIYAIVDPRITILFAVFVSALLVAGCLGEQEGPLTAEQVRDRTLDAIANVSTYAFDMHLTLEVAGPETMEEQSRLSVAADGAVDVDGRKSMIRLVMDNPGVEGQQAGQANTTLYFFEDRVYLKVFKTWVYQRVANADEVWSRQNQVRVQADFLQDAELTLLADEVVDGRETYVLQVNPDKRKVLRYMLEQSQTGEFSGLTEDELASMTESLEEYRVIQWMRKEDFLPVRFHTILSLSSENATLSMDMTMNVSDYGREFDLEEPTQAIELSQESAAAM